jgi:hypothetical protein
VSRHPSSKTSSAHLDLIERQIDRVTTLTESDYQSLRVMLVEIENNPRQPKRERTRASLLRVRIESATRQGWGKR